MLVGGICFIIGLTLSRSATAMASALSVSAVWWALVAPWLLYVNSGDPGVPIVSWLALIGLACLPVITVAALKVRRPSS